MNKTFKKLYVGMLSTAVLASAFAPTLNVKADPEPTEFSYTLNFTSSGEHTMTADGSHLIIQGQYVELRANGSNDAIGTASCTDNLHCKLTVTNGPKAALNYNPDHKFVLYMQGHEVGNHEFQYNEEVAVQDYEEFDPVEPGPDGPQFDGHAFLFWSCESGGVCYKEFTDIPDFNDGNSTFYKDTDIVDTRTGEHFNVNAKYKGWTLPDKLDDWVTAYKVYKNIPENEDLDPATVDPKDMLSDPIDVRPYEQEAEESGACTKEGKVQEEFQACVNEYAASKGVWVARVQLQPVGEPSDNNAYVSYGDRNFKVVVYNSNFKGITLGSLDDLDYYVNEWTNPFLRQDQFDISGTTKAKPTYINASLFEKTVNIKTLNYNGFEITNIEALDVPSDAVEIRKVDGEWKITFSSNFYDNVVFKVTDNSGKPSYFGIKRFTVDAWTPNIDGKPMYNADFYYEDSKSYTDFKLTARLIFKDGTYKDVTLTAGKGIDDGLGNVDHDHYEINGGKGLKKASFRYELTEEEARNIKKAYTNVELKGSTSTKFAGTYAGSGKGIKANIYDTEEDV